MPPRGLLVLGILRQLMDISTGINPYFFLAIFLSKRAALFIGLFL